MKKLYIVNVYTVVGGELIDTKTNVKEILTIHNEITDEEWTEFTIVGNRTFRYNHNEYHIEILGETRG